MNNKIFATVVATIIIAVYLVKSTQPFPARFECPLGHTILIVPIEDGPLCGRPRSEERTYPINATLKANDMFRELESATTCRMWSYYTPEGETTPVFDVIKPPDFERICAMKLETFIEEFEDLRDGYYNVLSLIVGFVYSDSKSDSVKRATAEAVIKTVAESDAFAVVFADDINHQESVLGGLAYRPTRYHVYGMGVSTLPALTEWGRNKNDDIFALLEATDLTTASAPTLACMYTNEVLWRYFLTWPQKLRLAFGGELPHKCH